MNVTNQFQNSGPILSFTSPEKSRILLDKPFVQDSQITFPLPTVLWNGEQVLLTQPQSEVYYENHWILQDRPTCFWRKALPDRLYGNILVDRETKREIAHVFYIEIDNQNISFVIPFENGEYRCNDIEELLCLLFHYCKTKDIKNIQKIYELLPTSLHRLSPITKNLIQSILPILNELLVLRFDSLGLSIQIVDIVHSWLKNPSLQIPDLELKEIEKLSLFCWELYRDLHQNIEPSYLLSSDQRNKFEALKNKEIKDKIISQVDPLFEQYNIIPKFVQNCVKGKINQCDFKSKHAAWHRPIIFSENSTMQYFLKKDEQIMKSKFGHHWDDRFYKNFSLSILKICFVAIRKLGYRHVWKERVIDLSQYSYFVSSFIPHQKLNLKMITQKRMALSTVQKDSEDHTYVLGLIDWALSQNETKKKHETIGEYLASV